MLAAEVGCMDIVRLLLEAEADVNKADNDGLTALMLAAKHGHTDIVNVLLGKVENVEEAIDSLVGYKKILIFN
jgi:ankyrin repeat protein